MTSLIYDFVATILLSLMLCTTYRSEIERLTALLHSRTTTSDVGEGYKANISNTSHVMRLEASTSGPLNKHVEERENFHAVISTPVVNSRVSFILVFCARLLIYDFIKKVYALYSYL